MTEGVERKYAREVEELLKPFPGREFKMQYIVRYVRSVTRAAAGDFLRRQVQRILDDMIASGLVARIQTVRVNGSYATYAWVDSKQDEKSRTLG